MDFKLLSPLEDITPIASGVGVKQRARLTRLYGPARWRKLKGFADVQVGLYKRKAEIHWYEAHGIGRVELKIKRYV